MNRVIRFITSLTGFICCSWAVAEESSLTSGGTSIQESHRVVVTLEAPVKLDSFSADNKGCNACNEKKGRVGQFVDRLGSSPDDGKKNDGQRKSFFQCGFFKRVFYRDDQSNQEQPEATRSNQELSEAISSSQEQPGAAWLRKCIELLK